MKKQRCGSGSIGTVLVLDKHEVVSVTEGQLILRCKKQLRVNGLYRVKSVRKLPDFEMSARVNSCNLQISRDNTGQQVPVYEAVLEVCEE